MSSSGRAWIVAGRQGASAMGKNYKAAFHALQQTASLQRLGWMGNAPLFAQTVMPNMKGSVTSVVANSGNGSGRLVQVFVRNADSMTCSWKSNSFDSPAAAQTKPSETSQLGSLKMWRRARETSMYPVLHGLLWNMSLNQILWW